VVGAVGGRLEEAGTTAEGLACGDWAASDSESARLVIAANRIGAKLCMWLVGRTTTTEVTRRNDALLGLVYRELRGKAGVTFSWFLFRYQGELRV
jgi:hypothetical protein